MSSRDAFLALVALGVELLRWAIAIGVFLLVLYSLVRFVKWAWTDEPEAAPDPGDESHRHYLVEAAKRATQKLGYRRYLFEASEKTQELAASESALTEEAWKEFLDIATGHDKNGRPICQRCGLSIPEGKEILLTDEETKALTRRRGMKALPGAFRHIDEADCGVTEGR